MFFDRSYQKQFVYYSVSCCSDGQPDAIAQGSRSLTHTLLIDSIDQVIITAGRIKSSLVIVTFLSGMLPVQWELARWWSTWQAVASHTSCVYKILC